MDVLHMTRAHADEVLGMMRIFYASPAVHTDGSEEIFRSDVEACVGDNPFLSGYVFTEVGEVIGYAMVARSFSTEFGKPCLWIEDLYLKPEHRGKGIATVFFDLLKREYPDTVQRLEVEEENVYAVRSYRKNGFEVLPYVEMKREF